MQNNPEESLRLLGASNLKIKIVFLTIIFCGMFGLVEKTFAACTGSSPTWTAASPSATEVNACIAAATAGDTINVPAGSATWGAGAVIVPANKPLQIIGAGSSSTIITLSGGSSTNATLHVGEYKGKEYPGGGVHSATRISGFQFLNTAGNSYQAIVAKGQGWRIDHNKFVNPEIDDCGTGCMYYAVFIIQSSDSGGNTMSPYGLIDNNIIYHGKINIGISTTSVEQDAWYDALDLGGITATYIENNQFLNHAVNGSDDNINKSLAIDNDDAAKRVIRYNYFYDFEINGHPWQSYGDRGPRKDEIYGNVFYRSSHMTSPSFEYVHIASGTGMVFNNNVTGAPGSGDNSFFFGTEQKRDGNYLNNTTLCGQCNGTAGQYWDGNESGQSGYLCRDQVGTGGDIISWPGTCPGGSTYYTQSKVPLYGWNNPGAEHGRYMIWNTDETHIIANRDYYYEVASFNGTVGVGCGTLASRPSTCTTGVGYWVPNVTDDPSAVSCTNLTNFSGVDATYQRAGTLYKCTATNTWTAYYTPYTYPHPLRDESSDTTSPSSPTGLAVE